MDLGLAGKTVLITGASSGIGAATAICFAQEGADVLVGYSRNEAGAAATAEAVAAHGRKAWCVRMDVADPASVDAACAAIGGLVPAVDVLVLNAGMNIVTPLAKITPEEWHTVMTVNLSGAFYVLRACLPLMRGSGSIVTVASVAGSTGAPHHAHYAAAKAGLINLTKSAARDLAPGIRVNCVSPGMTLTEMGRETAGGLPADYASKKLLAHRFAEPDEVARCIVFVASPAASFMYGATLDVNGGRELR